MNLFYFRSARIRIVLASDKFSTSSQLDASGALDVFFFCFLCFFREWNIRYEWVFSIPLSSADEVCKLSGDFACVTACVCVQMKRRSLSNTDAHL